MSESSASEQERRSPITGPGGVLGKATVIVGPALNYVPFVGAALAAAWQEWDSNRRFARVEQTMRLIQDKLQLLIPKSHAASDAGMQLLETVLREAQSQHCERKRKRLANVLVASWIDEKPTTATLDESYLFIRAVENFGDHHIAVLNKLRDAGLTGSVLFTDLKACLSDDCSSLDSALIALNDICSIFGFARRAWDLHDPDAKGSILHTGNLSPEEIARKCRHAITLRGIKSVDYIINGRLEGDHG